MRTSALDVADDGTGLVVHELDTALGDTTTGAYVAVSLHSLLSYCSELCALQHAAGLCFFLLRCLSAGIAYRYGQGHE